MHREELSKEAQLDLVDKAIVGDGQALEELLRSTSGLVFNLALRFLGTVHDAEDASQEIAVKIMTRLSTFRKESAFSTWVYRYASLFDRLPSYRPTPRAKELLEACMGTASFDAVVNAGKEASHA